MRTCPELSLDIIAFYGALLRCDEHLRDVTLSTVHGPREYRMVIVERAHEQLERIAACREPVPVEYRQQAERLVRTYTIN